MTDGAAAEPTAAPVRLLPEVRDVSLHVLRADRGEVAIGTEIFDGRAEVRFGTLEPAVRDTVRALLLDQMIGGIFNPVAALIDKPSAARPSKLPSFVTILGTATVLSPPETREARP